MKKSTNLNKLFIHAPPDLCLITDQSNGAKKFFVHKIILMCISPYFQKVIQYKNGLQNLNAICDCNAQSTDKIENVSVDKFIDNEKRSSDQMANSKKSNQKLDTIDTTIENSIDRTSVNNEKLIQADLSKTSKLTPSTDKQTNEVISEQVTTLKCTKVNREIEQKCSTLQLPGVNEKVLSMIINYAYNGQIKFDSENVQDLIVACDMYNIPALLHLCTNFLIRNLTIHNSIGIYLFAMEFNFKMLIVQSKKYILRNYEQIYESSDEFVEHLNASHLVNLLKQNSLYVIDEYSVFKSIVKWTEFDEINRKKFFGELIQNVRLAIISNERLQNQILYHPFVSSNPPIKGIVIENIKIKKYLEQWGKPNLQMIKRSTKIYLTPRYPLDLVFVFGGRVLDVEFVTPESMVEVYDHRAERWKQIKFAEDPAGARDHQQVVVIKSDIYVIGGHCGPFNVFNSCRKFNLLNKSWSEIAPMNEKRTFHASVVLDDTIYAIGGFNGSWRVNTVERYNVSRNQWQMVRSMTERRSGAGASVLNKKIYVVGGFRNLTYLRCAEFYDPLTNLWTNIALMTKPRSNPCVVTLNGFIYTIGGLANQKLLASAERYDSVTNSWTVLEDEMFEKKCSATAVVLEDKIFVIGGWNGKFGLHTVEIWCSKTKKWYQGSKLKKRRTGCCACLVKDVPNIQDYGIVERDNLLDERYQNANETDQIAQ